MSYAVPSSPHRILGSPTDSDPLCFEISAYSPEGKLSLVDYNKLAGMKFIALQEQIVSDLVYLGWPLWDYYKLCGITKPKDRRVASERKKTKHRKGKITYSDIQHLLLRLNFVENSCRTESKSEALEKFEGLTDFVREFDFSLITKIISVMEQNTVRTNYDVYWASYGMRVSGSKERLLSSFKEALLVRSHMMTANENLARWGSKHFHHAQSRDSGSISFEDFNQEGLFGLIDGLNKIPWDWSRGECTVTTIALSWIKHRVRRFLQDKCSVIRVPNNLQTIVRDIRRAIEAHLESTGNEPTVEELCQATDYTASRIRSAFAAMDIDEMKSLDAPVVGNESGETTGHQLMDLQEQDDVSNTQSTVERREEYARLYSILDKMPKDQAFIVAANNSMPILTDVANDLINSMIADSHARDKQLLASITKLGLNVSKVKFVEIPALG